MIIRKTIYEVLAPAGRFTTDDAASFWRVVRGYTGAGYLVDFTSDPSATDCDLVTAYVQEG